jgi:hypothetical protein
MASFVLALHVDRLEAKAALPAPLAAANRVIYVREGGATVRAGGQAATLVANSAWHGAIGCDVTAGAKGATVLRWELTRAAPPSGKPALAHPVELADPGGYLMRCDRVDFPPGGIAYTLRIAGRGFAAFSRARSGLKSTVTRTRLSPARRGSRQAPIRCSLSRPTATPRPLRAS